MSEREVTIVIKGKNLTGPDFDQARKGLAGIDDQAKLTSAATATLGTAFKALSGVFAIGTITSAINSYADLTGELTDLSAKTGIGVEALQRLKYAAEQNGGSLDLVTGAVGKLSANLAGNSKSAAGALDTLGLSFDKIRGMAPDQAFTTIADAIAKVQDPMAQAKLSMDLFGKSGTELLPMMKGNLSETAAAAERLGFVLSEEAVAAGDEFGDTMGTLAQVGKAVIAQVLEPMIPVLTTVAKWMGETLPGAIRFVTDALTIGLGRAFLDAKIWFNEFLLSIAEAVNKVPLLGEKIGFSAETIAGLKSNVTQAKDSLSAYTEQTIRTTAKQETASKTISRLNLDYTDNEKATKKAKDANEDLDPTIARLTKSYQAQIAAHEQLKQTLGKVAATPDWFRVQTAALVEGQPIMTQTIEKTAELQEAARQWAFQNGATLAPSIKAVGSQMEKTGTESVSMFAKGMAGLPNAIMSAIQGGGSIIGAAGSQIGSTLMAEFTKTYGLAIKAALPFGIGEAVVALLPTLGALFGPVAERIGGFFRQIFGGPSADELRGRQAVADFEAQLHSTLNATQKLEAGNVSWKMTVIALRDAFIAQGRTEAEALAMAEALWKSSQSGAAASALAIAQIQAVLNGATASAMALDAALDLATQDRTMNVSVNVDDSELDLSWRGSGESGTGFARGTFATTGIEFPDFGTGTRTVLHGREAVVPESEKIPTAARWLAAAGLAGVMAGGPTSAPAPNVYIVNDFSGARRVSEDEFRQIQSRLNAGGLSVPQRAIAQRSR